MNNLYIDLHVIQTVPPSCVNRDDAGSPKTALYGGVRRARVSSQSWKYAMRKMFRTRFDPRELGRRTKDVVNLILEQMPDGVRVGEEALRSRTREVINLASEKKDKPIIPDVTYEAVKKALKDAVKEWKEAEDAESEAGLLLELKTALADFNLNTDDAATTDAILKATDRAIKAVSGDKDNDRRKAFEQEVRKALLSSPITAGLMEDATTDALLFIGAQEAVNIANLVADSVKTGQNPSKEQVQEALNYYPKGGGQPCFAVDVALFGRMVAKAPALNVDASAQVAHAISTHKTETEFDYYIAADDRAQENNAGASMIGTIEFNSSTLYRYATIAAHELYAQLARDVDATAKAAAEFAHAFVRSMPPGRINSFANHILPDAICVAVRRDTPINLVGAFEEAVQSKNGYAKASVARLGEHIQEAYGLYAEKPEKSYVVTSNAGLDGFGEAKNLNALLEAIEADVREALQ